jgi:hypothetical protein
MWTAFDCSVIMDLMTSYAIQKRKFIMHSAHPTVGVSIALAARRFQCAVVRPRKVCAIAGPKDQPLAAQVQNYLVDFFADDYAIDWNSVAIKAKGTPLEDINPHDVDCLILLGNHAVMNAKALELIHDYWQCGGSLVAIRIADFALHGKAKFANELFGGEYHNEHLLQPAKISVPRNAGRHPLLRGVQPFISRGGLHRYDLLPTEATPILFGSSSGEIFPAAWVRSRLGRRVFATTLGSPADFRHPCFLRLLANAIMWTAR